MENIDYNNHGTYESAYNLYTVLKELDYNFVSPKVKRTLLSLGEFVMKICAIALHTNMWHECLVKI